MPGEELLAVKGPLFQWQLWSSALVLTSSVVLLWRKELGEYLILQMLFRLALLSPTVLVTLIWIDDGSSTNLSVLYLYDMHVVISLSLYIHCKTSAYPSQASCTRNIINQWGFHELTRISSSSSYSSSSWPPVCPSLQVARHHHLFDYVRSFG